MYFIDWKAVDTGITFELKNRKFPAIKYYSLGMSSSVYSFFITNVIIPAIFFNLLVIIA